MSAASTTTEPMRVFYGTQEEALNPNVIDFSFETAITVVSFDGGRFPVRVRSTWNGLEEIRGHIARLEESALQAEANLREVNGRCRHLEKRADSADWHASELRRAEFEWADSIPVDEPGGDRVLVRVRGTEGGIGKIKARLENLVWHNGLLTRSLILASDRALEAEAKLAALEAEQAEALANIAGFEVLPNDATTYTVSHGGATMTVTGSPSGAANVVKLAYGGFEYGVSA